MKYREEAIEMMEEAARLMGIEPGRIRIRHLAPLNDYTIHETFTWTMDECETPIGGRVEVFDTKHAPINLLHSFVETLSRSLRDSGIYEWEAKHVYYNTPMSQDEYDNTWLVIGEQKRHSRKTLLNDIIFMAARSMIDISDFWDGPIPTAEQALVEAIRCIDVMELLEDLREYRKRIEW